MTQPIRIELEIMDFTMMQMADAICKWNDGLNDDDFDGHIIDIEELCMHLKAYAEARRKRMGKE